ncbi:MAG: hypothetical protein R3E97_02100 [Candidatus Eisenbacteria bacterium]
MPQDRTWHWVRDGWFTRPSDQRRFQRFRCRHCGRRFSTRTFSATYWLKKRRLLAQVAQTLSNGTALRQAARIRKVSHSTIALHQSRLSRHCLLFQAHELGKVELSEPVVVDGFETFEYSQYFPFHVNLAVGQDSWYVYAFTDSPLRRKGKMTPRQKVIRKELEDRLGRPDPKAVETGMADLLETLVDRSPGTLQLHSDEHPAYPRSIQRVLRSRPGEKIDHHRTSSKEARTHANPLFPVNLADLLIRHSHANHRRETISFSKRRMGALERLSFFLVWRNYIKRRREKRGRETTAMKVGLADRPLTWFDILRRRLFPKRQSVPKPWEAYYERKVFTPILGECQRKHELKYAI